MPRLAKTRIVDGIDIGDLRQTDFEPPAEVPMDFDFATIPGVRFHQARLPPKMPSPLKISTVGDIEAIKASGNVKFMRLCIYVLNGDVWQRRSMATRDFSLPAPPVVPGKPDTTLYVALNIPTTRNEEHPLSGRDVCVLAQVLGDQITLAVEVESG